MIWFRQFYERYEIPTLFLGMVLYGSWLALTWYHRAIFGPLLFLAGGYVTQWHFSLQHESIHGMRNWSAWMRTAFVWPPIGLWMPYPIYHRSHSRHHVNYRITHPTLDTESYYHLRDRWSSYSRAHRALLLLNQTLSFRLVFGPFLRLYRLAKTEMRRLLNRDFSNIRHWIAHAISIAVLIYWVVGIAGMPLWKYLLCFAYPGMSLGMLRTFTEHRYALRPMQRVAIVESNVLMGVLFLYNNLHTVHHSHPTMPWYRIPAAWRHRREQVLAANGDFYYRGYLHIARRFLFRPVFDPSHPEW